MALFSAWYSHQYGTLYVTSTSFFFVAKVDFAVKNQSVLWSELVWTEFVSTVSSLKHNSCFLLCGSMSVPPSINFSCAQQAYQTSYVELLKLIFIWGFESPLSTTAPDHDPRIYFLSLILGPFTALVLDLTHQNSTCYLPKTVKQFFFTFSGAIHTSKSGLHISGTASFSDSTALLGGDSWRLASFNVAPGLWTVHLAW